MVTELLNWRNGQSPVSVCQSVSESVTMIIARDASASEKTIKQMEFKLEARTVLSIRFSTYQLNLKLKAKMFSN